MDPRLSSIGYVFEPSKYSPPLGHSHLKLVIAGKPSNRFFDVKLLSVPTFDGRFFHQTQITRHELAPSESFRVCLGELRLESFEGETLPVFSLGGNLRAQVEMDVLYCEFTSSAPIFTLQTDPDSVSGVIADEIMDLLAEAEAKLPGHEDELYSRLSKYEPYATFLSSLVSLQKRADSIPIGVRRERFHKIKSNIDRAIQIIRETDSWDGLTPSLEQLISSGGE